MDVTEASELLAGVVTRLRAESYPALVAKCIGVSNVFDVTGASGAEYCIEIQGVWDIGQPGDLRIMVGIDDGHFRTAFRPLTDDFVMAPDGSLVGE